MLLNHDGRSARRSTQVLASRPLANAADHSELFLALVEGAENTLSLAVRAHLAVDDLLGALLTELLPRGDALELKRISFLLKVNLLIALGVIRPSLRPLLSWLNSIRNRFAHEPNATFSEADAIDARNLVKSIGLEAVEDYDSGDTPQGVLTILIAHCYFNVLAALEETCRHKVKAKVAGDIARETVQKFASDRKPGPASIEFNARVRRLMAEHYPGVDPKIESD